MSCEIAPFYLKHLEKDRAVNSVLHLECANIIHDTLKAALLFHKSFKSDIKAMGFEINLHHCCTVNKIVNREQMTVVWHVDNVKASHMEDKVSERFLIIHTVFVTTKKWAPSR